MDQKMKDVEQWYDNNKALYERFSIEIEEIITKILNSKNIHYQSISHRLKERESYLNKCADEKYINPIKQITDVSGIRIIAYTNHDVSSICQVLQDEFLIDEDNSGDKADMLEINKVGYLSVHYILQLKENRTNLLEYKIFKDLKCEVQVRTLLQHAWAEIEHDRNYKFTGVLPDEIKRRFYLVAGVLEMMDCEFDRLSKEIDEYAKNMKKDVLKGNYSTIGINSKSVEQYVLKKFEGASNISACINGEIVPERVIDELKGFGYQTIQEIEDDFNHYGDIWGNVETTYIGTLRTLMIIKDCDKYFKDAYHGSWQNTSRGRVEFWKENGAKDVEMHLRNCDINIWDEK